MYALIRFSDEEKNRIVPLQDIKNVDAQNVNHKKKYLVKYEDGYYPAQIIVVKESIEELEALMKVKRLSLVNKQLLESASSSDSDNEPKSYAEKKKTVTVLKTIKEYPGRKKENENILSQFESTPETRPVNTEEKKNCEKEKELLIKIKQLTITNADLKQQLKETSKLNMDLQKTVIDHFQELNKFSTKESDCGETKVGGVIGNQVHLGRGIHVSKEAYNDAWFMSCSGPQFVKTLAVAVFGSKTLLQSSVTGKASNNYKKLSQKPGLDATKLAAIEDIYRLYLEKKTPNLDIYKEVKAVKTYVANKISDLQKGQRRLKKPPTRDETNENETNENEYQEENKEDENTEDENTENREDKNKDGDNNREDETSQV